MPTDAGVVGLLLPRLQPIRAFVVRLSGGLDLFDLFIRAALVTDGAGEQDQPSQSTNTDEKVPHPLRRGAHVIPDMSTDVVPIPVVPANVLSSAHPSRLAVSHG